MNEQRSCYILDKILYLKNWGWGIFMFLMIFVLFDNLENQSLNNSTIRSTFLTLLAGFSLGFYNDFDSFHWELLLVPAQSFMCSIIMDKWMQIINSSNIYLENSMLILLERIILLILSSHYIIIGTAILDTGPMSSVRDLWHRGHGLEDSSWLYLCLCDPAIFMSQEEERWAGEQ